MWLRSEQLVLLGIRGWMTEEIPAEAGRWNQRRHNVLGFKINIIHENIGLFWLESRAVGPPVLAALIDMSDVNGAGSEANNSSSVTASFFCISSHSECDYHSD